MGVLEPIEAQLEIATWDGVERINQWLAALEPDYTPNCRCVPCVAIRRDYFGDEDA